MGGEVEEFGDRKGSGLLLDSFPLQGWVRL